MKKSLQPALSYRDVYDFYSSDMLRSCIIEQGCGSIVSRVLSSFQHHDFSICAILTVLTDEDVMLITSYA